jgi:hypothetical protein
VRDRRAQLVDHQLHPQLGDLMLDDEEHLVVPRRLAGRARQRLLRVEQPVEAQVAAVGEAIAQIGDDAGFEVGHCADVAVRADSTPRLARVARSRCVSRRAGDPRFRVTLPGIVNGGAAGTNARRVSAVSRSARVP